MRDLGTDLRRGLSSGEADLRLAAAGPNQLAERKGRSLPAMVADAATEPFVLLLMAAGIGAVLLGEVRDGLLVLAGLVPIVGADVITEYRGERALDALRQASAPVARVRRDGRVHDVPAASLVPGDVVLLRVGDVVPADLRVADASNLLLDRSVLTGESLPEPAAVDPGSPDAPVTERRAIAYSGTSVVGGTGLGTVVATGPATELGAIAARLGPGERRRSPLQRELDRLVRILLVAAVTLIAITVGLGFLRGQPAGTNLLAGISAAIAAIPEEPPILLAVILGLGAYRLLRRGVLVRRLSAQETLGAIDLILTDKTGTITENRLRLLSVLTPEGAVADAHAERSLIADALHAEDDAWRALHGARPGSFTQALAEALAERGVAPELDPLALVDATPPAEGRPFSSARLRRGGRELELALGAPEALLALDPAGSDRDVRRWREAVTEQAASGARLVLLCERRDGDPWQPRALLCFADALRPGVPDALATARRAGIQTVIVTGDHPMTAAAIAAAAGIEGGTTITGGELAGWDDRRLAAELPDLRIVARALPDQKHRLVDAARRADRTVAVTGDGVNDAPALQHADVAVAMGSGTAVAKEASDLVLNDNSFATLMYGLREGRRIIDNVQKGLVFLISTHVALLGFILVATAAGHGLPLLPLQILWLELFIDISAAVAFEREGEEPDVVDRPPRPRHRPLLDASLLARVVIAGGFTAVAAFAVLEAASGPFEHVRWLAYTVLVVGQLVRAYANRSLAHPVAGLRANGLLAGMVALALAIQVAIPYLPGVAEAFRASPLTLAEWALVAAIALAPAAVAELIRRRGVRWVA